MAPVRLKTDIADGKDGRRLCENAIFKVELGGGV